MILGRPAPPGRIAIIHPDPGRAEALARALRPAGHRVQVVTRKDKLLQSVVRGTPDLLIGATTFPEPGLGEIVQSVRQALGAELPVIAITAGEPSASLIEADALLQEPVSASELEILAGTLLRHQSDSQTLKRKVQELLGLYKISWGFSLEGGPEALNGYLARQSAELLRALKGLVLLYDESRRQMVGQAAGFGLTPEQVGRVRYPVDGEARSHWNFRTNGPLLSNKAQADSRLIRELVDVAGISAVVVAPITRGPRVLGLLAVADHSDGKPFGDEDLSLLVAVAAEAAVAVENLRLHEELKRANALLEEHDRLKSEFVAMVAHDFRRPLMAIRGFAELVLEEHDLSPETRAEYMSTVIGETDELALLADDTLLITRIETGAFEFRWDEIDLGPFILELIPLGLSDHSVLLDIPPHFPRIVADRDRLKQVLTNLVSNAVKYSPGGGSITIRCRERGPLHVSIEVSDHGLGIPQDQIGRLFQKFQRVRSEDHLRISGTGLGLYICRLIVEGHGGQLWVESELGTGSTFGLVLPLDARARRDKSPVVPAEQHDERPAQPD